MEPRLSFVAGQPVVVGLTWEIGGAPRSTKRFRIGPAGQGFASYAGSIAEVKDAALLGHTPLATLVGVLLADEPEVIAAIVPLDEGTFWGAQFKDGSVPSTVRISLRMRNQLLSGPPRPNAQMP